MKEVKAALGLRIKTGWATAVLLSGRIDKPILVDSRIIQLCDPSIPDSRQPFHVFEELSESEGKKIVLRLCRIVEKITEKSISELWGEYRKKGYSLLSAGLVVGSMVEPETIRNAHIRFHAEEGKLYRNSAAQALAQRGLRSFILQERDAYSKASQFLKHPEEEAKSVVRSLGEGTARWRSEEKLASLAAWMGLSPRVLRTGRKQLP